MTWMEKKDIESHMHLAWTMEVPRIASMVFDLQCEKDAMAPYLTEKELENYDTLIDIYSKARISRLTMRNYSTLIH